MKEQDLTISNLAAFYTIDEEGDDIISPGEVDADFEEDDYRDISQRIPASEVLRIEQTIRTSWSGVDSCKKRSRATRAVAGRLEEWANGKMREHRGLRFMRYGLVRGFRYNWQSRRRLNGSRRCWGWSEFRVFIEFTHPQ